MPNGETMVATHTALLPFSQPPLAAWKFDVFPELQQPLLFLGQFFDAGFTATLNSDTVLLTKDGSTTLSGTRYYNNGIYFIPLQGNLTSTPSPLLTTFQQEMSALTSAAHTHPQAYVFANSAYHMIMLPALVQFLHRACFRPVVDTWCKAIDAGYLNTCPGLTSNIVRKHLPTFIETANGHFRLAHQHIRPASTQPPLTTPPTSHTPTYDDSRNSPHEEPSPRKPGIYAAGRSVRPDLFRSNRPIPQSLQQGGWVSDCSVLL